MCLLAFALVTGWSAPLRAQLARETAIAKAEGILKNLQDGRTADIVADSTRGCPRSCPNRD